MDIHTGFIHLTFAFVLSVSALRASAQRGPVDPPCGQYVRVDAIPASLPGEYPALPIFRPANPPIHFGDPDNAHRSRQVRRMRHHGKNAFRPSGNNFGTVNLDSTRQRPQTVGPFQDFPGSPWNGWTPGDPDVAVGNGYVCQVVNDDYTVYDKCGNIIFSRDANDLFATNSSYKFFDPHIIFDPWNGRWVMTWHVANGSVPSFGKIFMVITSSPDPVGVGAWYYYPLDMVQDAGTANESFPDYYDVGYSSDLVYLAGDQYAGNEFRWSRIVIFRKSEIYNGAPAFRREHYNFNNPDGSVLTVPRAVQQQSAYPNTAMFLNSRAEGGSKLTKWTIADPFGANTRIGTDISVSDYSIPPSAVQPNTWQLDTLDCRLMSVVQARDNRNHTGLKISTGLATSYLWAGDATNRSACRLYHIDEETNAVVLDTLFGAPNYYYWYPSVAADFQDTATWVFARCGTEPDQFAEIRYVSFEGGTFINASANLHAGSGNYGAFRWGDYFGASLDWDDYNYDPDRCRIWMTGMYAIPFNWTTHIGSVSTLSQGVLNVAPSNGLVSEGPQGGPFTITSQSFTLTNSGDTGLHYTVSADASLLISSVSAGELYHTPDSDTVTISLAPSANLRPPGTYNAIVSFRDCANGGATLVRPVQLVVRPRNDDCASAITHPGGTLSGTTVNATGSQRSSCAGSSDPLDVWYAWTASCTGTVAADTCGSSFDTSLSAFASCTDSALELACSNDVTRAGCLPSNRASRITWNAIAGHTYRIRVAGTSSATGAFNLYIGSAADFNRDGIADFFDYLDFVNAFATGLSIADFNADGLVDFFDYLDFLQVFSNGC